METTEITKLMRRAGTIESALAYLGDQDDEVIRYKKILTILDDPTDHLLNYQTVVVLVRAVNEKREPDWNNPKQWKYFNWFEMGGSRGFRYGDYVCWGSNSDVGSRLCFFDSDQGEWLANQHPQVFKNFMLIIKK
jgi:hypothetical protein